MGIKERKEREKEQRRADILVSARTAFVKYGFEQTSMDRIASEAELSKGTLYLYFRNRDELLLALIAADFEELLGHLESITLSKQQADKKLLDAFTAFYDYSQVNEFMYRVMTQVDVRSLCSGDVTSESAIHFRSVNARVMSLIVTILEEGVRTGVFHINQPYQEVVTQMVISLKGAMIILRNSMIPPDWIPENQRKTLREISCLFIRGLSTPNPPECCA